MNASVLDSAAFVDPQEPHHPEVARRMSTDTITSSTRSTLGAIGLGVSDRQRSADV